MNEDDKIVFTHLCKHYGFQITTSTPEERHRIYVAATKLFDEFRRANKSKPGEIIICPGNYILSNKQ